MDAIISTGPSSLFRPLLPLFALLAQGNNGVYGCVRFDATTKTQNWQQKHYSLKVISKEGPSSVALVSSDRSSNCLDAPTYPYIHILLSKAP